MQRHLSHFKRIAHGMATAAFLLIASNAQAGAFSFTGNFSQDDNVFLLPFMLTSAKSVTLETWSYAGGTNAAGSSIAAGGFDPIVSVYTAAGTFVGFSDDGIGVTADPGGTGEAFDSKLTINLGAGSYLLALTQWDNFPNGNFSDGLSEAGNGNFTAAFGCGGPSFCDADGNQRTSAWALDVINADQVPEPASLALLGLGLLGFGALRRRRA